MNQPDELQTLIKVCRLLEDSGLQYMLTGSMAMSAYGIPRMTRDIDIVVAVQAEDISKLVHAFAENFFFQSEAAMRAIQDQTIFNVFDIKNMIKVDIVIRKNSAYRRNEFDRRKQIAVESCLLWIVSPEDLIISKLDWAKESRSEMQLLDVKNLLACVADLDEPYLHRWIKELGLDNLYLAAKK